MAGGPIDDLGELNQDLALYPEKLHINFETMRWWRWRYEPGSEDDNLGPLLSLTGAAPEPPKGLKSLLRGKGRRS